MRTKISSVLSLLLVACTFCACTSKEPRILTVYYSHWGGTEILANLIHTSVGGDIFVIEPVTPYPAEGTHAAAQKHVDEGFLPPLKKSWKTQDRMMSSLSEPLTGSIPWLFR
ncbi:MAG: hypothetical protein LUF04_06490 [Bacteroides sp.]|nr:hypothetical protein [Bacteroides sp.]